MPRLTASPPWSPLDSCQNMSYLQQRSCPTLNTSSVMLSLTVLTPWPPLDSCQKISYLQKIQSSWIESKHLPRAAEVHTAAELVTSGYLSGDVMTTLATRIQSFLSDPGYKFSDAEFDCIAALVTSV